MFSKRMGSLLMTYQCFIIGIKSMISFVFGLSVLLMEILIWEVRINRCLYQSVILNNVVGSVSVSSVNNFYLKMCRRLGVVCQQASP